MSLRVFLSALGAPCARTGALAVRHSVRQAGALALLPLSVSAAQATSGTKQFYQDLIQNVAIEVDADSMKCLLIDNGGPVPIVCISHIAQERFMSSRFFA